MAGRYDPNRAFRSPWIADLAGCAIQTNASLSEPMLRFIAEIDSNLRCFCGKSADCASAKT